MDCSNLTKDYRLVVERIVCHITYSGEYQYKIVQNLVCERVLELIKGREDVSEEEIFKIAKDLIFKHSFKFRREYCTCEKTIIYLLDTLKKYNYYGEWFDRLMIEDIVRHALLEFPITNEEMERTIIAIAQYEFDREENNYGKFKEHLLKSKLMKNVNVPLVVFENINKRFVDEYGHLYDTNKKVFEIDYDEIPVEEKEKENAD